MLLAVPPNVGAQRTGASKASIRSAQAARWASYNRRQILHGIERERSLKMALLVEEPRLAAEVEHPIQEIVVGFFL